MDSELKPKGRQNVDVVDYNSILDSLTKEDIKADIDFLGTEPININTTNAQQIFNHYQMYSNILVFDLRSRKLYKS